MKKFLLVFLCVLSLFGCVPAALVVGATAGGSVVYDNRPMKTMIKDRDITQTAQNSINQDLNFKHKAHINVATINGSVLMVGQANTPELRDYAYKLVSQVKDVRQVYNQVVIAEPTSLARRTDDSWITTKVRAALLTRAKLSSTQIKVLTENGVVYLMGEVDKEQAELASDATRRVNGVKQVVKSFEYT